MNKSIKFYAVGILFLILAGCSSKQNIFVGETVDIRGYKRPSNIIKYQWSFDTKPPTSRLDPRDFIPSNYHPNVTFIPDVRGRYVVRLTMINDEGNVIYKNFEFKAEAQPDYLTDIDKTGKDKAEDEKSEKAEVKEETKPDESKPPKPKVIEIPKVTEKTILKKTIVTKRPNEWQKAPKPGESIEELEQEPAFFTETVEEVIEEGKEAAKKSTVVKKEVKSPSVSDKLPPSVDDSKAAYTVQVASSPSKEPSYEFLNTLKAKGFDAYIQTATVNGTLYYRIRIGRYAQYQDAKTALEKIRSYPEYRKLEPWIDKIG
jgi:septal ring-binding cell division protein DamX